MELRLNNTGNFEKKRLKSQYRQYFSNYSFLITLGIIWVVSSTFGAFSVHFSIFLFLSGITLTKPILSIISKILLTKKINKGSTLKLSTRLLILGMLFGLSTVFFPFVKNVNLFYPAFNVITGLVFISISFVSTLRFYFIMGVFLIINGTYTGYHHPENFCLAGLIGGCTLLGAGLLNGVAAKIFMHNFKNRKRKSNSILLKSTTLPPITSKPKITENI